MKDQSRLPQRFRKLSLDERQKTILESFPFCKELFPFIACNSSLSELADAMIEGAVGIYPVPFGVAAGFLINGKELSIPMATEEPSVIAAAAHGAALARSGGGFAASSSNPIATAQIYLSSHREEARQAIMLARNDILSTADSVIPGIVKRNGGCRGIELDTTENGFLCISIHIDVQDAMGANIANTIAESLKSLIQKLSGGEILMAILTNASEKRTARAEFRIPEKYMKIGNFSGEEVCARIVGANELAEHYPKRAITHNKGILNGISALALATSNDTRAVEAAAHFHGHRAGSCKPLTSYRHKDRMLYGCLELPTPFGTVGGSISIWPGARFSLGLLGNPGARELSEIAAALGLAQNLAALQALVTEGIQKGHMKLHAAKVAYAAGARGDRLRTFAAELWREKIADSLEAKKLFDERVPHELD